MSAVTWQLRDGGRLLEIFQIDPQTRRLKLFLPLRVTKPMTDADAQRYIDNNFPVGGSAVKQAAETLSKRRT